MEHARPKSLLSQRYLCSWIFCRMINTFHPIVIPTSEIINFLYSCYNTVTRNSAPTYRNHSGVIDVSFPVNVLTSNKADIHLQYDLIMSSWSWCRDHMILPYPIIFSVFFALSSTCLTTSYRALSTCRWLLLFTVSVYIGWSLGDVWIGFPVIGETNDNHRVIDIPSDDGIFQRFQDIVKIISKTFGFERTLRTFLIYYRNFLKSDQLFVWSR